MKIFLRILVILLVGAFVASALYLMIENTSLLSDTAGFPEGTSELGERPELPDSGEIGTLPEGEHDHHAASLSRGLSEIGVALAKISGITLVVLLIQGILTWLKKRLPSPSTQIALSTHE